MFLTALLFLVQSRYMLRLFARPKYQIGACRLSFFLVSRGSFVKILGTKPFRHYHSRHPDFFSKIKQKNKVTGLGLLHTIFGVAACQKTNLEDFRNLMLRIMWSKSCNQIITCYVPFSIPSL
jgi:hypothetical protein